MDRHDGSGRCRLDGAARSPSRLSRRALLGALVFGPLQGCRASTRGASAGVVSLSPSTTEAVFALGQGARLVGRSQHCDFPSDALRLPSVGGYADPDVERILALAPGLVVGERGPAGPALEQRLAAHSIATFFPPTGTVAEVGEMLVALGGRLGVPAEGERVRDAMARKLERISRWARTKNPVSVVMVFDARPLFVAGPGGFPDELVRLAGATNSVQGGGAYPTLDVERLLALNPDVVVDATEIHGGPSRLPGLEGWSRLDAVRSGRVRTLSNATAMRPGPRLAEGLAEVVRVVHGEAPPAELFRE